MEKLLINYKFNSTEVDSDGAFKIKFTGCTHIAGPGNTSIGNFQDALDLGTGGKATVDLTALQPNTRQFCLQISFKINSAVTARQNILESNYLPFALFADKSKTSTTFELYASVNVEKYGWSAVDTEFKRTLQTNKWYTASIVYDNDTLGLFIDDDLISVNGFPIGGIKLNTTKMLYFGTWVDGARNQLNGALAAFKWYDGIPPALESRLDEKRSYAEWHITYKYVSVKSKISVGKRVQAIKYDATNGGHTQLYESAAIMYHENVGVAFEMHGAIYAKYKTMRNASALGFLVTDESTATNTAGRKNLFSKGGIYWSSATGANPVLDEIYLEYENLGESKAFGFPVRAETSLSGGREQQFQRCRIYYKNGTGSAKEVHGAILTKFLSLGGVRTWGFPVTNESDIRKGNTIVGKFSEFENCTLIWKSGIGAFILHGDIRRKYMGELGGATGRLGFPTSDEINIPNHSGLGKMSTFEKGSMLWYGSYDTICVATLFKIFMQRIESRESEGWGMDQNDLHFYARVKSGATMIYDKRHPNSGDYGDHNIKTVNITIPNEIVPNAANMIISFSVDIRDSDPGNDDHLGTHTTILNAANAWGFRQPNKTFNDSFSKIKSFTWSIKPVIEIDALSEVEKWWKFDNFKTPVISKTQYASAFEDVDSEADWWNALDWLKKAFYEIAVKGVASGGNCFGMSLESIYARKNMSLFGEPINTITDSALTKNEINIKHTYQVGARPIWWFLGQFVSGNTHDPRDVFNATRSAFLRGDHPVVCISKNYDFSGSPHCILPVAWKSNVKPWRMSVLDPNMPNEVRTLFVNPDTNSYSYQGETTLYKGEEWSGGRLHYMPFCILDTPQRTPVWDAILLLLSGTILILADDAETISIKDANGNDLDGNGARAREALKKGHRPEEYFASFTGFDTHKALKPGQIMLRREKLVSHSVNPEVVNVAALPLNVIMSSRRTPRLGDALPSNRIDKLLYTGRSAHHILNDTSLATTLSENLKKALLGVVHSNNAWNFQHELKGIAMGKLEYIIKQGLSEIKIDSTLQKGEINTISVSDLSTNASKIFIKSPISKNVNLQIINKLGVNGDYIQINVKNIPIQVSKPLAINIKQGFAGIELENNGINSNLPVQFSGSIDGKSLLKNFNVPFADAVRIKPSSILNSDELLVSDIVKLFGNIKDSKRIMKTN